MQGFNSILHSERTSWRSQDTDETVRADSPDDMDSSMSGNKGGIDSDRV